MINSSNKPQFSPCIDEPDGGEVEVERLEALRQVVLFQLYVDKLLVLAVLECQRPLLREIVLMLVGRPRERFVHHENLAVEALSANYWKTHLEIMDRF